MFKWIRNKKGLSLIEVLVSVTILSLVVVPMFGFFTQAYSYTTKNKNNSLSINVARNVLNYIERQDFNAINSLLTSNSIIIDESDCSTFTASSSCTNVLEPTINNITFENVEVELKKYDDGSVNVSEYQKLLIQVIVRVTSPIDNSQTAELEGLIAHETIR